MKDLDQTKAHINPNLQVEEAKQEVMITPEVKVAIIAAAQEIRKEEDLRTDLNHITDMNPE